MEQGAPDKQIGYILRSYPRLSQTFILNEILALEQLGMDIQIFAVTNPHEEIVQAKTEELCARVKYLNLPRNREKSRNLSMHRYWLKKAPKRYSYALQYTILHPEIDSGYRASSRFDCFNHAAYLAWLIDDEAQSKGRRIGHLHAHFAHDPTFIAQLVHMITGISYSFTAHARDLYQLPVQVLDQRVRYASSVFTCCQENIRYFEQVIPASSRAKVHLIHHGIDLQEFQSPPINHPSEIPLILSIGRLVEKKGFFDLLLACEQLLQTNIQFRIEIYGDGPLRADLDTFIHQHGLSERVKLAGTRTQKQLIAIYQQASIFALTPSITEDGDRDGIPNVLIEAMACGIPVVSTSVGGIPELVHHDENGLLFNPHDTRSVAIGLKDLLSNERKRQNFGAEARRVVTSEFDINTTTKQLAALFETTLYMSTVQGRN